MSSTSLLARSAARLVALGVLALYGGVSGSTGCGGDQACIQWGADEGPCPPKDQAIRFMAPTCDVRLTIESEGDYDGVTCCYDVTKEQLEGCEVDATTTAVGVSTSVSASAVTSTSSGPPPSCDFSGDCTTCQRCAMFSGGCMMPADTCNQNPECTALRSCLGGCPPNDTTCINTCLSAHVDGQADLEALTQCTTCQECSSDCGCMSG